MYYIIMLENGEKLAAFIVPTGVGASIGGYAGDASVYARRLARKSRLIVNPNVVNAGGFSGITDNMLYVEGYSLDEFFKGNLKLKPSKHNKIGILFDKSIPQDVMNVHINTVNAVKCIYGVNIGATAVTEEDVGVEFKIYESGISSGCVKNQKTLLEGAKKLIAQGCDAIAIVCMFENSDADNEQYSEGIGVDPIGGVEAVISHYISKELKVPCAHSPAFADYSISSEIVDIRSASEYITPTFLPCILLGLDNAPLLCKEGIGIENLDCLYMPYNSLGSTPVFEALKRDITVYALRDNTTVCNVSPDKISSKIKIIDSSNI